MKLTINKKALFLTVLLYVFAFQRALISVHSLFSYLDEILAIYVIFLMLISVIQKNLRLDNDEIKILLALVLVSAIGFISNLYSGLLTNGFAIIIDFLSLVKVWLSYYYIVQKDYSLAAYDKTIKYAAGVGRVIVVVMVLCLVVSHVHDFGMLDTSVRYGIASFKFVFNNAGNFSKFFYFLMPVLTADLYYKNTPYKNIFILGALIVWASTLRTRAFAFIIIYLFLYFLYHKRKYEADDPEENLLTGKLKKYAKKIKWRWILLIGVIGLAISWNQLLFYFTSPTQARALLLRYGVITLVTYFPLGAGFGTYGSDIAANYYSPLYTQYGFNEIWGMSRDTGSFLNDNYWPMIMGQFGIIGTILILYVVVKFLRLVLKKLQYNRYFYLAGFVALFFLLLSSVASKSYSEFSSICVFMFMGILVKREQIKNIRSTV